MRATLGLDISDAALLEQIMQDPNFKDATGNFSPALFQQALRNIGLSEQGFLASQRETNLRRQILTTIGKVVNTPEVLVDALDRYNGETRTLRYVLVAARGGRAGQRSDRRRPQALLRQSPREIHPARVPQGRHPRRHAGDGEGTGEDHRSGSAAPPTRRARTQLGKPEKRHVQQIAFPDMAAATAAHEKIQSGTDFVAVAKEQGLSEADIDLGMVTRSQLADPAVADAAFKLELNKVSEPVTGKLGTVVLLRVTEIDPGKTPTFDEAKADLEKKLLKERASGAIFELHDKIEDQLAAGAKLSEVADKLKLNYQVIDQVDRDGPQAGWLDGDAAGADAGAERGVRHRCWRRERSDRRQGRRRRSGTRCSASSLSSSSRSIRSRMRSPRIGRTTRSGPRSRNMRKTWSIP